MRWHVVERLSPRQALTPDGYLIVTDTIIARCGDQIYHDSEVPLDPGDDGMIRVSRDATEVFRPESIASFEGKPITDDHPEEEVTPENHRHLAIGHVQNVRRGSGDDNDCLVADLVFTDPEAIRKVRGRRKLALSCGYDASYEHVSKGRGAQRKIVGNHVALVDEGRCGARCTIGDSGAVIFSYLSAKTHDAGCACDACHTPAPRRRKRGRLNLWVDGRLLWRGWTSARDFDPGEPRKGTGPGGGQWTSGGGGGGGAPGKSGGEPPPVASKGEGNGRSTPSTHEQPGASGRSGENVSAHFTRRTAGNGGSGGVRPDGVAVRSTYESSDAKNPAPVFDELGGDGAAAFAQHITDSKKGNQFGASVAVYPTDEYAQMRLFSTPDAKAGFALHGDDIISVYRKTDGPKGAVPSILALATQEGGRRLDCFDTVLPKLYASTGFRAVARLPFNDEYKPEGWDYATYGKFNQGRPDVVFMVYDPKNAKAYQPGDGVMVDDYDKGTALQHAALSGKATQDYDPNEPRVKGGPTAGQWTAGGGAGTGGKSGKSVSFSKTSPPEAGSKSHGVAFASWANPPKTNNDWDVLAHQEGSSFSEPTPATGGKQGAGVLIREPDGRVWIVHPSKQFGGYKATFPKGTQEPGMSLRGTAVKEAFEESGLHVKLTGYAGDVKRTTGTARYYWAERVGGTPADHGWESEAVTLAHPDDLKDYLNEPIDQKMVDDFIAKQGGGGGASPKSAPAPAASGGPIDISKWKKVGSQLGSNPGGKYQDENGKQYYVKQSKSDDHAKNEFLAARLYEAAGAPILPTQMVDVGGGKLGTATPWQDVTLINKDDAAQRKLAQEHFGTHAWLANWDAAGLEFDNQGMVDGKMTTLDPGGSLLYRAQGQPKGAAFGDNVAEWDSMRKGGNAQAAAIYGEMTGKQLRASALNVAKVPDKTIDDLTFAHGPGTYAERVALATRIKARKRDLIKRAMQTNDARWRPATHIHLDLAA